jgi:hypothetical protein
MLSPVISAAVGLATEAGPAIAGVPQLGIRRVPEAPVRLDLFAQREHAADVNWEFFGHKLCFSKNGGRDSSRRRARRASSNRGLPVGLRFQGVDVLIEGFAQDDAPAPDPHGLNGSAVEQRIKIGSPDRQVLSRRVDLQRDAILKRNKRGDVNLADVSVGYRKFHLHAPMDIIGTANN